MAVSRIAVLARKVSLNRIASLYVAVVIVAVIIRYCFLDARDPFKCGALLNQGFWLDPAEQASDLDLSPSRRPFQRWQPKGCIMHDYGKDEISRCLQKKRILIVGDSSNRQIFWAIAKKLDLRHAQEMQQTANKTSDLELTINDVQLEFMWDPFLNSSRIKTELDYYRDSNNGGKDGSKSAAILLFGTGHWYARHQSINMVSKFKSAIDEIILYMISEPTSTVTVDQSGSSPNLLLLAPVQVPWYDKLSPGREESITKEKINGMNDYLQSLSAYQAVDVAWSFSQMSWQRSLAYEESGLHVVENVAARRADVLLNLRCNAESARGVNSQGYPYDRTCCSNYRRPSWVQLLVLLLTFAVVPYTIWKKTKDHKALLQLPGLPALWAIEAFFLSVTFCFYADRTQMFNKASKVYKSNTFMLLLGIFLSGGLLSTRRNPSLQVKSGHISPLRQVLSPGQTEEWKGWMLAFILAYYYSDGAQILWIYRIARLLIGAYLFIMSYGNTIYYLQTSDYSFERVASTLIRLNLLSCVLSFVMRTEYVFYYFAPLVSFWFLVLYLILSFRHRDNGSALFLLVKMIAALVFVIFLSQTKGVLEFFFKILKYTCNLHWDAAEWRLRIHLDILITFVGLLCGYISNEAFGSSLRTGAAEDPVGNLFRHRPRLQLILVLLAIFVSTTYFYGTASITFKAEYNGWHPFASLGPILSFVVLRNATHGLRSYHSRLFAWLGSISIEAMALQYHIWLAGDTNGLLSLGIFDQRAWHINLLVVTPIFFFVSWTVMKATHAIADWILQSKDDIDTIPDVIGASNADLIGQAVTFRKEDDDLDDSQTENSLLEIPREASTYQLAGWKGVIPNYWKGSLKNRLVVMFVAMWIMNWTT